MTARITNNVNDLPTGLASQLLSAEARLLRELQSGTPEGEARYDDPDARIMTMRAAQYRAAEMRGLAPLWKDAQEEIDNAVVRVGREGLTILRDRMEMFPVPLPNWLSVLQLTSHKIGESRKANVGMVPGSLPDGGGLQNKVPYTLPIYVIWDEFEFNARELAAAQRSGHPLQTDEAEQAVRNVNYTAEDAIINGLDISVAGDTIPGLLDTTTTQAYETNTAWDGAKTGAEILVDVQAMRAKLAANKFYGPYSLYVPTAYGAVLQNPFDSSSGDKSIQAYLENLVFGGRNLRVVTSDLLPANRTLLVEDTAQACDVIVGQEPVVINPAPEIEFRTKWLAYACIVSRVKSDIASNFRICAGNTT